MITAEKLICLNFQGRIYLRRDACNNFLNVIELLRLPRMSYCDQVILRWCSLSVLNLANHLSFESREEGAGGDVPL